jgi:general secretion pathway protein J
LITNISDLSFEFYDGQNWQTKWSGNSLPLAIAIEIETDDFGYLRRQFLVAGDKVVNDKAIN